MMNPDGNANANDRTRRFARDHFEALRKAGLATWTFDEFLAFCAPLARQAQAPVIIEDAACTSAQRFADAVDELLRSRHGQPLTTGTRHRIVCTVKRALIAGRRRRLRRHTGP